MRFEQYDIAVVGGGMVGGALACTFARTPLRVVVIDRDEPQPFRPEHHDLRVSAITLRSQRILQAVGVWDTIARHRICPFRRMRVWELDDGADAVFDSAQIAQPALGYIVENSVIQRALFERARDCDNIDWVSPATPKSIDLQRKQLILDDGRRLQTRLVIGADGARSKIRELAGIACDTFDYHQHALVATVNTCLPQQDITWQRHAESGPQAFLPLTGNRGSIVWYHTPEEVQRLLAMDEAQFCEALMRAFPASLGGIESVTGRASFPIVRLHAKRYVSGHVALIGDAAHVIHPHLGQGANLGFYDAAALAKVILDAVDAGRDFACFLNLRRYERWRKGHNLALIYFAEGVYHAFAHQQPPLRVLRNAMLGIAGRFSPANRLCMYLATGLSGDFAPAAAGEAPARSPGSAGRYPHSIT